MNQPNFTLLYVDAPASSAEFYAGILGSRPVQASPTFVLFALQSGLMLGLWSKHAVEPAPASGAGAAELGFQVESDAMVDALYTDWLAKNVRMAQGPLDLDFGRNFLALDPDGHRLRVFAPRGDAA